MYPQLKMWITILPVDFYEYIPAGVQSAALFINSRYRNCWNHRVVNVVQIVQFTGCKHFAPNCRNGIMSKRDLKYYAFSLLSPNGETTGSDDQPKASVPTLVDKFKKGDEKRTKYPAGYLKDDEYYKKWVYL